MTLEQIAVAALLSSSALLGVKEAPVDASGRWEITQDWTDSGSGRAFAATSRALPEACRANPAGYVEFPMIIHAVQEVALDGRLLEATGNSDFKSVGSFYGVPTISCERLAGGKVASWRVDGYSRYFSRFPFFPRVVGGRPAHNFFAETMHALVAGATLAMSIFLLTIFLGKVSLGLTLSVSGSCLFASAYFAAAASGILRLRWPMLEAHRFGDLGIWVALALLFNAFRIERYLPRAVFAGYLGAIGIGCALIAAGNDGDMIQFGSSFAFIPSVGILAFLLARAASRWWAQMTKRRLLYVAGLFCFVATSLNEIFAITGLTAMPPLFPIGFLAGIFFFAFGLNERIAETYRERDYLRDNLEDEVRLKTQELQAAMGALRATQAELVQSAKLASLGTLSAGIAHEINNSLNYVNGALAPLAKLVEKSARPEDRPKADRLLEVMREGLSLTLEIIRSLRSHSGINQSKFNDVSLRQAASSSLAILRSRTRGKIDVDLAIPEGLLAFGSVVGLNQVFMNLIANAIDAMPDGGRLEIAGEALDGQWAVVRVRDTGSGMSAETAARVFEPFFTTKEVGKGTGLGLHIVRGEIEKHGGAIAVESELGKGTCFTVRLPIQNERLASQQSHAAGPAPALGPALAPAAARTGRAA
jgi:signal transduction histidine kinase